jgi:uncharacterized membrane protein YbhN (UPF0104 family)
MPLLTSKHIKIFNYIFGIGVMIWMSIIIYRQVQAKAEPDYWLQFHVTTWALKRKIYLAIALFFILINWGLEAIKWQILLRRIEHLSFIRSLRSVFTGISVSIITPNRIGEYAGRIIYLKNRNRITGIAANIVGSIAQFISAAVFGILGLFYFSWKVRLFWFAPWLILGSILVLSLLVYTYFRLEKVEAIFGSFTWFKKHRKYIAIIGRYNRKELIQLISLSAIRYLVFASQNYLLLLALGITCPAISTYAAIFAVFWCLAVLPSLALAELPMRTQISYYFLSNIADQPILIMSASFGLWCINLILPAVIGLVLMIGARIFGDDSEK